MNIAIVVIYLFRHANMCFILYSVRHCVSEAYFMNIIIISIFLFGCANYNLLRDVNFVVQIICCNLGWAGGVVYVTAVY